MDDAQIQRVIDRAVEIQRIAAPTFAEFERSRYVMDRFFEEGLADVTMDEIGNVFGRLPGSRHGLPVVVSAHLDTVFPSDTDLAIAVQNHLDEAGRIYGPGIGDNSIGVAGLFGLVWAIRQAPNQQLGDVWLVANVGEEGLGDLRGMRAVVERFDHRVRAYIILEGMALGQIYHRGLSVERYRITARTVGGHSWVDFGSPSAINELAGFIDELGQLPLARQPRTTWNVGIISGGTSVNTIAAEATLELDLRSESEGTLRKLAERVSQLILAHRRPGVDMVIELIGQRPAGKIEESHPLVQLAIRSLKAQGIKPHLSIGSTDANIPLSRGLPAVCVGLTIGHGAHTLQEYIHIEPLKLGLAQLVDLVSGAFDL